MSDSSSEISRGAAPESAESEAASAKERKTLRLKTIKFVVIFVGSVFLLLAAHGMLVNTRGNDYYLYQVARSAVWLLDWCGDSARVVGSSRTYAGKEAYVRASMAAWRNGEPTPPPEQFVGVSGPPLTAWESWEYHAASQRRELKGLVEDWESRNDLWRFDAANQRQIEDMKARIQQLQSSDLGPKVTFVLRRGLVSEISDVRRELAQAQQEPGLTDEQRSARVAEGKARLAELDEKRRQAAETAPETISDVSFSFTVVPDCGAIPTMVIFMAAVLAFPALWWKKLAGLGMGVPFLYAINTLRLTVLAVIGAWDRGGEIFDFAHKYIWQAVYIIFVVVVWLAWVELLVRKRKQA